jgi:hypothetical protein
VLQNRTLSTRISFAAALKVLYAIVTTGFLAPDR